jgi:hypothetical protein
MNALILVPPILHVQVTTEVMEVPPMDLVVAAAMVSTAISIPPCIVRTNLELFCTPDMLPPTPSTFFVFVDELDSYSRPPTPPHTSCTCFNIL